MKKAPYLLLCITFCQVAVESTCNQRRLRWDSADMQAGLNLRWLHTSYYRFCRVLAQIRVCWVYTLEPPWSGNSNEYTYCFSDKKICLLLCITFCQVAVESTCNQRRLRWDCADMQAGLNLRWLHTSYYRFCRVLAQIRVCWVYTLEPPWSCNSNEYTYCFSDKKIFLLKISLKICFLEL